MKGEAEAEGKNKKRNKPQNIHVCGGENERPGNGGDGACARNALRQGVSKTGKYETSEGELFTEGNQRKNGQHENSPHPWVFGWRKDGGDGALHFCFEMEQVAKKAFHPTAELRKNGTKQKTDEKEREEGSKRRFRVVRPREDADKRGHRGSEYGPCNGQRENRREEGCQQYAEERRSRRFGDGLLLPAGNGRKEQIESGTDKSGHEPLPFRWFVSAFWGDVGENEMRHGAEFPDGSPLTRI